jgi:ferric-dicitrate binding protein FerR (iron transport regulator)
MTRREFNAALRDADRTLADASSRPELDLRIWRRLQERQARPRWRRLAPRLVLASAIGVVAAIVFVVVRGSSHPPAIQPIAVHEVVRPRLGGFVAVDGTPDLQVTVGPERTIEVTAGRVTLLDEARGVAIQVATHARVRGERDGVRVVGGTVDVRVDKRPTSAPPARILVSHGVIEVLGTEFRIEQAGDQGRVSLREGAIRFVAADGRVVTLAPGDALTWPLPSLAPPPASIETATPAKPPTKAVPIVPPSVVAPPRTAAVDPSHSSGRSRCCEAEVTTRPPCRR